MQQEMHANESKNSCRHIIKDDSNAFGKSLQLPDGRGLDDVEGSEKYKTRQKRFPPQRYRDQRDELPGNFINHHKLGILHGGRTGYARGSRNADQRDENSEGDCQRSPQGWRGDVGNSSPKRDRSGRCPGARTGLQSPNAPESRN